MKKILFFIALLSSFTQMAFAQTQTIDNRNNVSLSFGGSLFGRLRGATATPSGKLTFTDGKTSALPTIQVAYDYKVNNVITVGIAGAYNNATLDFKNIVSEGKKIGDASATLARTSLAARILFNYRREKFELYTGTRLGVGLWSAKLNADLDDALVTDLIGSVDVEIPKILTDRLNGKNVKAGFALPQVQIIPIGARYFFTDNIGAHAEFALGAPYVIAAGLNFQF